MAALAPATESARTHDRDQFQRYVRRYIRKSAPVIRIQIQGTRHDPRQEPYAVALHVRI